MGDSSGRPDSRELGRIGEHFAAGYFELPDASPVLRWSRAVRRWLEDSTPPPYSGGPLYPCGGKFPPALRENRFLRPEYSYTWQYDEAKLREDIAEAPAPTAAALQAMLAAMREPSAGRGIVRGPHTVGGAGYTHSIPNYGRAIREGLAAHGRRVERGLAEAEATGDAAREEFYMGLGDVVAGIRRWHERLIEQLRSWSADDALHARNRDRLVRALAVVPFRPAGTFFEALLAYNLVYYLDGCDNPGRIDQELGPYYDRDLRRGTVTREAALELMRAFHDNVADNHGWSAAVGGTGPDGKAAYNEFTRVCLAACVFRHRPSYELRIRRDMPDDLWDAALDALATGCGNPALYNEEAYLDALRQADLGIAEEDLWAWNGGGCTETMVHGCSNVGSLDAGINLPLVLVETLRRELARDALTFEELLAAFEADLRRTIAEIAEMVNRDQETKAAVRPQPMRSLLIDDCIDRGLDFNAGGARYNWSVVNVAGLANVVDSLAALREVVFERREKTPPQMLSVLESNFADDEPFRQRLKRCPRFGNDDPAADDFAARIGRFVFTEFRRHRCRRGGRFLPSCLMFETYAAVGRCVGATPDGRLAGEPLSDSIGPYQGRDTHGPTAMLQSVARVPLHLATGTPVLNIRLSKGLFADRQGRRKVRQLVRTFFDLGGMQLQVSVVDQAVLRDAIAHPERHEDLIVRIGGYSAYFNRLSPELKQTVLQRTEHL